MTAHDVHVSNMIKTANVSDHLPAHLSARARLAPVGPALPHAVQNAPTGGVYRTTVKRILDITLILIAAPVVAPLIAFLALCIALTGGQPLYSQSRVGRNGRTYKIWKLRTMVRGADDVLEQHLARDPALRAEWNSKQKLLNDPRITAIGKVLRKCSIDELPQLWNVLRGDMSLVGPRPMMVCQKEMYPGTDYYALRPGITGMWQISDRNDTTFAARAQYDARYNANLSFQTDVKILLGTVRVVLRGTGH